MNLNDEEYEQLTAYRDAQLRQRRELAALRKVLEAARAVEMTSRVRATPARLRRLRDAIDAWDDMMKEDPA